ncbi:MAG: hypothetical protein NT129_01055 [Candidatus Aenigmarchaeota archaeon]|nr:hypothetical protein [Candidatus Aenigmarchaeota archaeon]
MNKKIRISLDLDKEEFEKFSIKCVRLHKKKSVVLRDLLKKFLEGE